MRSIHVVAARALLLLAALASTAAAHGGIYRGPQPGPPPSSTPPTPGGPPPTTGRTEINPVPGSPPSLVFSEERWEFWWEFNHDAWVNLRPSLLNAPAAAGGARFVPVDAADRAQVLLPALVELLRDENEQVRSAAVYSLAHLEDASTLPYLSNAVVGDPSLPVRTDAVIALGLARNPKATERLRATFYDDHVTDEMRAFAAIALGVSGLPDAAAVLRDALAGGFESRLPFPIRAASIYALGLTQDPGNAPFLRTLYQARGLDEASRALVVEALGRVGDRAANPLLLDALVASHMPLRRSAAIALGVVARPEDADVIKALEHAVDDDADGVVRSFAEISLGRIASLGAPPIVERLRSRLKNSTYRQRPFVALALGISGYESAAGDLLAMFKQESNPSMRGALAIALSLLGQKEATHELHAAFRQEKEPQLRGYLAYALGRLGAVECVKELREVLAKENDPQLLYWSAIGLGLLGDRSATTYMTEIYGKSKEQITRSSFLHALGAIGDRGSAEFLIDIARNPSETDIARAYAVSSLGMLCEEDRVPRAALFSRDHNYSLNLTFIPQLYYLF
jgi:HEAT repeat protein